MFVCSINYHAYAKCGPAEDLALMLKGSSITACKLHQQHPPRSCKGALRRMMEEDPLPSSDHLEGQGPTGFKTKFNLSRPSGRFPLPYAPSPPCVQDMLHDDLRGVKGSSTALLGYCSLSFLVSIRTHVAAFVSPV